MNEELVSIITPSFNTEKFIAQTIESVLNQTYEHWEMIIVDDSSSDNSVKIIEKYMIRDNRIKLFKIPQSGPALARNKAIEESSGRYIAFLDSDDLWEPQKLTKQIKFMVEKDCALTYSNYDTVNEEGTSLSKIVRAPKRVSYENMLKSNFIGCLTSVYDTKKVGKIYLPLLDKGQDYALWLNILKKTDYAYNVDGVLASYRIRSNSITRNTNKFRLLFYQYELYKKYENFSVIKSLYYVGWNVLYKIWSLLKSQFKQ